MNRPLGCFSIYGLIASCLALIGIGAFTWSQGAVLFSPGPLTAASRGSGPLQGFTSHANLERECTLCHRPWSGVDAERCLACHTAVREQIATQSGLHGRLQNVEACTRCHGEHQGREAEISAAALAGFAHQEVGFSLRDHRRRASGAPFGCADCHTAPGYAFDQAMCTACHRGMDAAFTEQHLAAYSATCLSCHTGSEALADFDHQAVYALEGAHSALPCGTCHAERSGRDLSAGCAACHQEPEIHQGWFGADCAACHTALGWRPASLRYHTFPLEHAGTGDVACQDCHPEDYVSYSCTICHEHEQAQTERQHRELGIDDLAECARCHPRGEVQEDG